MVVNLIMYGFEGKVVGFVILDVKEDGDNVVIYY